MTAKRKRPRVSKSKMGDAFLAQLGRPSTRGLTTKEYEAAGRARVLAQEFARKEELLRNEATARTWFFYGWQACERSKKP